MGMQLLSIVSRLINVLHLGKANETFSERTERNKGHWYFGGWRKVINGIFRLFGQAAHTAAVYAEEQRVWVDELRHRGWLVEKDAIREPAPGRVRKASAAKPDLSEHQKDLEFTTAAIAEHAAHYEMHKPDLYADWSLDPKLFIESAYLVDWPQVVAKYPDEVLSRVLGSGTNFNFQGHSDLMRLVNSAVKAESSKRAPDAPATNGMVR